MSTFTIRKQKAITEVMRLLKSAYTPDSQTYATVWGLLEGKASMQEITSLQVMLMTRRSDNATK